MADSVFKDWKDSLQKLHSSIGQGLAEMRSCKAEVERLRDSMVADEAIGKYIRDDKRIVLSAPEIIIGNVGKDGVLKAGSSTIIIRGHDIGLEGVDNGTVTTRASSIQQIAEDPGIDGNEHVVQNVSQVISMARNVALHASDADTTFYEPAMVKGSGVQIHSDTDLTIDATVANERRSKAIEDLESTLKLFKTGYQADMKESELETKAIMAQLDTLFTAAETLNKDVMDLRANSDELTALNDTFHSLALQLAQKSSEYIEAMSNMAETVRQLKSLTAAKKAVNKAKSKYKTNATGASLSLQSETISLRSVDGDGNLREKDTTSGIDMQAKRVSITSHTDTGELMKESSFKVNTENVLLDTRSQKLDDKGENGDAQTTGAFALYAKDISLLAVNDEVSSKKIKEKALVKDSKINLRAENVKVETTDTEGKATGNIQLNTKAMEIKAVDVDKDKRTEKEMAKGSTILVFAEKMQLGSRDKSTNKAEQLQIAAKKVQQFAKDTLELNQGDGKALVQLDGGNYKETASANDLFGKTTVHAEAEVKADFTAPKGNFKNVETNYFKSQDITDSIPIPAPPCVDKLTAKLSEEEAKKEKYD